jgi:putative ABC transport system permease protein
MINKIAWRNILRNKRRSLILIISIVIGVTAAILTDAFSTGMMEQMLTNQIGADVGYIQIHKNAYQADPTLENSMKDPLVVDSLLTARRDSLEFSKRLRTFGLVSSAYNSSGVSIVGVVPEQEKKITTIWKNVVSGTYLTSQANQALISSSIAEKLHVGLGDKVVIMASRLDGSVGSEACRIVGIYETFDSGFDQTHVYVPLQTIEQMLSARNIISEFVIAPKNQNNITGIVTQLKASLDHGYEVLSYEDMLPLFVAQIQIYDNTMFILYVIIAVALLFGIINTMLMAVMERTHEFGVDMAIGMSNRKIFRMILIEAFFIGIIGTAIGTGISYVSYLELARSGWNLAAFSESLKSFGAGTTIYPVFVVSSILLKVSIIPIATVEGAVYPAIRAIRLRPVEAIRAT